MNFSLKHTHTHTHTHTHNKQCENIEKPNGKAVVALLIAAGGDVNIKGVCTCVCVCVCVRIEREIHLQLIRPLCSLS